MSDWAERMTQLMRKQGAALNGPQIQLATMTGVNTLAIGQLALDADDLVFSAHLLNTSDMPILKAGDTVAVLQMSDSRFWVLDKVGGGMVCDNRDQTTTGMMLDARQGYILDGLVDTAQDTADEALSEARAASSAAASAASTASSASEAAAALVETKLNAANVVNNLTTTSSGYALDARQGKALDDKITTLNLVSATRYTLTETTGSSGNIALGSVPNDGLTAVVGAHVSGMSVMLRAWVSGAQGVWFLTAIDPNTGATVNNAQLNIRYWILKFRRS